MKKYTRPLRRRYLMWRLIRRARALRCAYCNALLNRKVGHARQLTVDHVVPKSQGGRDRLNNLVLACATCNRRKGAMSYWDFMASHSLRVRRASIASEEARG